MNQFMQLAIQKAQQANNNNEVPIGAVITLNNKIIATSSNEQIQQNNPLAHAEIIVLNQALIILKSKYLYNCHIYVTLEPCVMCASAISYTKISRLYFGAYNKKYGSIYNGSQLYQGNKCNWIPEVYDGIAERQCSQLLENFFINK